MKKVFITGVDTDIGKTFVSLGLIISQINKGNSIAYYKPFQSGAYEKSGKMGELLAPDIEEIKKYTDIEKKYSYLLKGEVSPYLAGILANIKPDIDKIKSDLSEISKNKDIVIIEGAGGLYCPVYSGTLFLDIVKELNLETIIVTTPKLGRINHTLMTLDCANKAGVKIKGVIVNKMPEKPTLSEENFIKELSDFSKVKIIGVIPEIKSPDKDAIFKAFKDIDL